MSDQQKYQIVDDEYDGVCVNLLSAWDDLIIDIMDQHKSKSILLKRGFQWSDSNLNFLMKIPDLKRLYLFATDIKDLSIISELSNLEVLYLECPSARYGPDFGIMDKLVDLRLDWRPCFKSLHGNQSIETLRIEKYGYLNLELFNDENVVNRLILIGGRLTSLKGIEGFSNLEDIKLFGCTKLQEISWIRQCDHLKILDIESCKKVTDLEAFTKLSLLEFLNLDKCGSIKSINGISTLNRLAKVHISDTNIEDGDVSELKELGHDEIYFDNKRHYSHKREEIRGKKDWE